MKKSELKKNTEAPGDHSQGNDQPESTAKAPPSLMESIGIEIAVAHTAARGAFVDVLMSAAKCGLLLLAAKAVKPGEFEAWFEQSKFGFSKVTRCKYMRLANRLCEEGESKPGLLLSIQPGTERLPVTFTFDELRLRTIVSSVSDGRSLSELYVDWDITKRPQDEDKATPPNDTEPPDSPKKVFGRWSGIVEKVPKIFPQLGPDEQSQLMSQLEHLLAQLQAVRREMSSDTESK